MVVGLELLVVVVVVEVVVEVLRVDRAAPAQSGPAGDTWSSAQGVRQRGVGAGVRAGGALGQRKGPAWLLQHSLLQRRRGRGGELQAWGREVERGGGSECYRV